MTLNGLTANSNVWIDVVNGGKLLTSGNVTLSGSLTKIRGIGALGLVLTSGDGTGRDIRGVDGNEKAQFDDQTVVLGRGPTSGDLLPTMPLSS